MEVQRKRKGEERTIRFKRIAEKRTNRIIRLIRLLGNCSNKSSYLYTDTEVKKIFSTIEAELKEAKSRFVASKSRRDFKL
jgi:hypothetical protein